jgi:hypothetical protein
VAPGAAVRCRMAIRPSTTISAILEEA